MKKTVILCLAIIMCTLAVTGSIAYFTDSIEVRNTVKSGNLDIEQNEYMRGTASNGDDILVGWREQNFYPAVKTNNSTPETVIVNDKPYAINKDCVNGFVDKIVVVENQGSLQTYVRTFVAVPAAFADAIHLEWNESETGWVVANKANPIQANITCTINEQQISGPYAIYYATYQQKLAANNAPNKADVAPPSLLGFYLDSQVNHNGTEYTMNGQPMGSSSELKILVATQAAQAIPTGIGEETSRMEAVESLTETYDKVVNDEVMIHHPWVPEESAQ